MMRRLTSKSGATAIEYALMIGLVALLLFTAVGTIGAKTAKPFNSVAIVLQ